MKHSFLLLLLSGHVFLLSAQNFEGVLTYTTKAQFPDAGRDSLTTAITKAGVFKDWNKQEELGDSITISFLANSFKKTYHKKEPIEYLFDFERAKQLTHTPKYECIDTTDIKLVDYSSKVKIVEVDSIYIINGEKTKKIHVSLSDFYLLDIYSAESSFKNMADAFIYEINSNLLFQNLYFLKDELAYTKIVKLTYTTKSKLVIFKYLLSNIQEDAPSEKVFRFPEYEYCFWDTLDNKKLMRKHRKRKKMEKKKTVNK